MVILLGTNAFQQANANDGILNNGHSIESIRAALKSPIPYDIQRKAQEFDDSVLKSGKALDQNVEVVIDERHDRAVRIVTTLLDALHSDASKWTIRVLDTNPKIENAFVVGGTYIYVYTGLLDNVQSDDELAFVLAHEISHSLLKHGIRKGKDSSNLLASIIELSGTLSKSEGRREKMGMIGGAMKASYSREDEQEADALGAYIANRANFDPTQGIAFFSRQIRTENAADQNNQQQLAKAKQKIEQQMAACSNMQTQWNNDPRVRSQQNAQIVNSTCQTAQANAQHYNEYLNQQSSGSIKSVLLQTHPADRDRIGALAGAVDYLKGKRSLSSLSGIGQGYNVFIAINLK